MRALVLGATGFIGSHVVRALLKEEMQVRILRRNTSPTLALEGLKIETVVGDLEDPESLKKAIKGCDLLFHVAGYYPLYSFEREKQKQAATRQMNNVLLAAENSRISKIVYTSSASTIGKSTNGFSNEETPYDPSYFKGLYYEIKYLQEQQALEAAGRGLPIVIVNPTAVFGDYDVKPTSGALILEIAKKRLPFLFDAPVNVVDVRDVAAAQMTAMKKGQIGRRYILGSHNTSVWEFAHLVAHLAQVPPPKAKLPLIVGEGAAFVSEIAGKLLHRAKPLLPRVGVDFLKYGMHYDTTRAKKELGMMSTPIEKTIESTLSWFRNNKYL